MEDVPVSEGAVTGVPLSDLTQSLEIEERWHFGDVKKGFLCHSSLIRCQCQTSFLRKPSLTAAPGLDQAPLSEASIAPHVSPPEHFAHFNDIFVTVVIILLSVSPRPTTILERDPHKDLLVVPGMSSATGLHQWLGATSETLPVAQLLSMRHPIKHSLCSRLIPETGRGHDSTSGRADGKGIKAEAPQLLLTIHRPHGLGELTHLPAAASAAGQK